MLDATFFGESGRLSDAVAERVAVSIGATRGKGSELRQCTTPQPGRRRTCTMRDGAVVLAFARPVVSGDTATVEVLRVYQFRPGRTAAFGSELTVVRTPAGDWRVRAMRETGAS